MKTYVGNFCANNGTGYVENIQSTNKKQLIKDLRATAEAERFAGNIAKFWVAEKVGDNLLCVYYCDIDRNGRHHINDEYIGTYL